MYLLMYPPVVLTMGRFDLRSVGPAGGLVETINVADETGSFSPSMWVTTR